MVERDDIFLEDDSGYSPGAARHWLHQILLTLSILAALWEHGHPIYTIVLLCAIPPCALLYHVPRRFISLSVREGGQILILGAALAWGLFRFVTGEMPDRVLIEGLSLVGVSLSITGKSRDDAYQFIICVVLVMYGTVVPRAMYVYVLPFIFLVALIITYLSRPQGLANAAEVNAPKGVLRRNWHFILAHLGLTLALSVYLYAIIPVHGERCAGFIPVSFLNRNEDRAPPDLHRWLNSKKLKSDITGLQTTRGRFNPVTTSKKGPLVQADSESDSMSVSGSGGSPPGDDIVFRVKSPVKLYWLCRLFDVYDGEAWKASKALRKQKFKMRSSYYYLTESVRQDYIVEKWRSPFLAGAYRASYFQLGSSGNDKSTITTTYNCRFKPKSHYPELPFSYHVTSYLNAIGAKLPKNVWDEPEDDQDDMGGNNPKGKQKKTNKRAVDKKNIQKKEPKAKKSEPAVKPNKPKITRNIAKNKKRKKRGPKDPTTDVKDEKPFDQFWFERIKPEHYLRLPKKKISARLKKLVERLVAGVGDPYERAIILRDYLRDNFEYEMMSTPPPEGAEPVDFFIFELEKGHCEYFAAALTVMARLAGLPSRVATGYSPGNYNVLTKYFDVREYHAHAWTQIFIPGKGWLTFDPTPPGQVVSRTTPIGIGSLHDPFSDEWRVRPPELTKHTMDLIQSKRSSRPTMNKEQLKKLMSKKNEPDSIMNLLSKIPVSEEELKKSINDLEANIKTRIEKNRESWSFKPFINGFKNNVGLLLQRAVNLWRRFIDWFSSRNAVALFTAVIMVLAVWRGLPPLVSDYLQTASRIHKCRYWMRIAERKSGKDARLCVSLCYRIIRVMLILAGLPRENNVDLIEYGESLKCIDPELSRRVIDLFKIYTLCEYSGFKPTLKQAGRAWRCVCDVRPLVKAKLAKTAAARV